MRREIEVVVGDLQKEKVKAEELQQTNQRLKWKLENAERRAEMGEVSALHMVQSTPSGAGRGQPKPPFTNTNTSCQPRDLWSGTPSKRNQPKLRVLDQLDLHKAASEGKTKRVSSLLNEADDALKPLWPVNGLNKDRETPLHWASSRGHKEVVKKLLEHGADLRLKDRWGQTAAEQALNMGHYAVSDLLDKAEEQSMEREQDEQQLHLAISSGLMRSTAPARRMPPTPLPDQDRDSDSRGSSSPRYEHQASTMPGSQSRAPGSMSRYRVLAASILRQAPEMNSPKVGVTRLGEVKDASEVSTNLTHLISPNSRAHSSNSDIRSGV